jgi:hypothetical protein
VRPLPAEQADHDGRVQPSFEILPRLHTHRPAKVIIGEWRGSLDERRQRSGKRHDTPEKAVDHEAQ